MSLQASWNSALGILGGIGQMKKQADIAEYNQRLQNTNVLRKNFENAQRVATGAINTINTGDPETVAESLGSIVKPVVEEMQNAAETTKNEVGYDFMPRSLRKSFNKSAGQYLNEFKAEVRRASNPLTNQMAAQRAQEHIQQADTPRNSGAYLMQFLRDDNETGGDN